MLFRSLPVTVSQLTDYVKKLGACQEAVDYLNAQKPERDVKELITDDNLKTQWMLWLVEHLPDSIIKGVTYQAYEEIERSALETYEKIEQPAWETYLTLKQSARENYDAIRELALEDCEEIERSAWKTYKEIDRPAWETYMALKQSARETYEEIMRPILIQYIPLFIDLLAIELQQGLNTP